MELYIRIKDGQPFEHPILGDNFRQVFPNVDVNDLPSEFARFEKRQQPDNVILRPNEKLIAKYIFEGSIVVESWEVAAMSQEEFSEVKNIKLDSILRSIEARKEISIEYINSLDGEPKILWEEYLNVLNNTIVGDDVFSFVMPHAPVQLNTGEWVTINSNGQAPNVIS